MESFLIDGRQDPVDRELAAAVRERRAVAPGRGVELIARQRLVSARIISRALRCSCQYSDCELRTPS